MVYSILIVLYLMFFIYLSYFLNRFYTNLINLQLSLKKSFFKIFSKTKKILYDSFLRNYVNKISSLFLEIFKKINNLFENYWFYLLIVLMTVYALLYFDGVFFDLTPFIDYFVLNWDADKDDFNFSFLERLVFTFGYPTALYNIISSSREYALYIIFFLKNFFFEDVFNLTKAESLLDYKLWWSNKTHEFSSEFFLTLYFYKVDLIFEKFKDFFNFDFFFENNFINENPIFFYTGFLFLFSTLLSLVLMSYLGLYGVFLVNLVTLASFWISVLMYFDFFFVDNNFFKIVVGKWFTLYGTFNVNFELYVDSISYSFMLLTVTIAMFVYIYVYSYFRYDANVERLILFINCFVISMVILVVSGNLFVFFLGWELIGLTSFLLINFWSSRISTLKSAFKAYTFNKFSDVSILISVVIVILLLNDVNIITFNNQISLYKNYYINILSIDVSVIEIISFFFISAAFVKSAQFGAHIWLPDSMEAPVPASALIHSATLVSAGVFLLLRFSPLFEISTYAFYVIPFIGSFTAFFGGICSCYQSDIKRILAYSTISHCGFLMVSYSLFIPEYTILYLYVHGFFKAAVFLCAGNIIRFSRNYQDFKKMGFFAKYIPFEFFASFVCLINLCGLPFTLGFYIKHLLVLGLSNNSFFFYFFFVNIIGGAVSGLFYSYKFFFYSFLDVKKAKKAIYDSASSKDLNSFFYSNSSLASNITITALIIVSYIISLKLFNVFLNKNSIGSGLDIHTVYNSLLNEFVTPSISFLENVSYFNWLILFLLISLVFVSWRAVNNFFLTFYVLVSVVTVFFFFYALVQII